jgi:hypothetical protein
VRPKKKKKDLNQNYSVVSIIKNQYERVKRMITLVTLLSEETMP